MEKIRLKEKVGYGLGDAASSMFWKLFGMYLLIFYTDVFGLSAAAAGTMFLVTRVWDSFFDPVVGVMADRTQTRWGKFRPYLLWMAIPFGIIGFLTFCTPSISGTGKLIYAYVTYSLMMMVYSLINVPYAALLGVITDDPKTRTELSSYRMIFAFAGSFLTLLMVEPLVEFFSKTPNGTNLIRGWEGTAAVFSAITICLFWACFTLTRERVKPIIETNKSFKRDFKDLWANRPWWILFGAGIAALIFNSIRDGAALYYFKYYVEDLAAFQINISNFSFSLSLGTVFLILGQAANIVGILIVPYVSNKIGKQKTYMWAMIFAAILSLTFYFAGKNQIWFIMGLQFVISMCAGSIFPLLWSMYADTADYSELKTGRRATGLIFSSSSMSQKIGWAIGGTLSGWLLAYYGYKANVVQTQEAQEGIKMMVSFFPAIGAVLSVIFISFYPLTQEKLSEITAKLNVMRNKQN